MDDVIDLLDSAMYRTVHGYVNPTTGKKGTAGLAPVIGMPASTLQNKANPTELFANFTVKEMRQVMLATGDHQVLHQLAADVGEACHPLPTLPFPADMDLLKAWAEWQAEIAETVEKIKQALSDKTITAAEVAEIRLEMIQDFEKGLALLDVLKGMQEPVK